MNIIHTIRLLYYRASSFSGLGRRTSYDWRATASKLSPKIHHVLVQTLLVRPNPDYWTQTILSAYRFVYLLALLEECLVVNRNLCTDFYDAFFNFWHILLSSCTYHYVCCALQSEKLQLEFQCWEGRKRRNCCAANFSMIAVRVCMCMPIN